MKLLRVCSQPSKKDKVKVEFLSSVKVCRVRVQKPRIRRALVNASGDPSKEQSRNEILNDETDETQFIYVENVSVLNVYRRERGIGLEEKESNALKIQMATLLLQTAMASSTRVIAPSYRPLFVPGC